MSSTTVACCRTKRGCFAKSSPAPRPAAIENTYNDLSTASSGYGTTDNHAYGTLSVAATDDRIYYNDSAAVNAGRAPTTGNDHAVNIPDDSVQYDALWNASSPNVTFVPQHHPTSQAQSLADRSRSAVTPAMTAEHRDSGLTLVENTLYDASESKPNDEAFYVNAAFHGGNLPTSS